MVLPKKLIILHDPAVIIGLLFAQTAVNLYGMYREKYNSHGMYLEKYKGLSYGRE